MGYYIEVPENKNKALQLRTLYGGVIVPKPTDFVAIPNDKALVVVVDNCMFEAAGLAFSEAEFKAFTNPNDNREKQFVLLDKKKAFELACCQLYFQPTV